MTRVSRQQGFTLIEIAIVLLVVVILLGYSVAMFPMQQELKQYRHAEEEMEMILDSLVAYAQVNGRLPCPDTIADAVAPANAAYDGLEDRANLNACEAYFGFLPARTIGINGKYDSNNRLIDPWGSGYGYAVSDVDAGTNGDIDLVTADGIRDEGIANVVPDLFLCDDTDATPNDEDDDCTDPGTNEVIANVAAVIISLGKNAQPTSDIETENFDDFDDGTDDHIYIFSPRRDDYDDIVKWISPNLLYSRMIEADRLP